LGVASDEVDAVLQVVRVFNLSLMCEATLRDDETARDEDVDGRFGSLLPVRYSYVVMSRKQR